MDTSPTAAVVQDPLLRVRNLTKTFPGLTALDRVSLDVHAGEIVSVVGQNGSGKSTLVKVLAGLYHADPGAEVELRDGSGHPVDGRSTEDELRFIHQDLGLVQTLSTVENLDIGRSHRAAGLRPFRRRDERRAARASIARFGGTFDVDLPVVQITQSERAIVAIARAMDGWTRFDRVLVLDEPTAALPAEEAEILFEAVRRVASHGAGVIFISHRLDEVLGLSDRILALRDGRVVADVPAAEVDRSRLISLIAGRAVSEANLDHGGQPGALILSAEDLQGPKLAGVGIELRGGEIVGVAGLLGSGREDLAGTVFGATPRRAGAVAVDGKLLTGDVRAAIRDGLAFVPDDRARLGAIITMTARENLTLPHLRPLRRAFGRLDMGAERREAFTWSQDVDLRPPQPERRLGLFSGGNQQKVVLAKWLRTEPRVLLLDEPTQGIDVGAKASIYELLARAAAGGAAVLVASSDNRELAQICDRVLVLRDGRITALIAKDELSESRLVAESLGIHETTVSGRE